MFLSEMAIAYWTKVVFIVGIDAEALAVFQISRTTELVLVNQNGTARPFARSKR